MNKTPWIVLIILSILSAWVFLIFYEEKDDFDIEFREKLKTTAIIENIETEKVFSGYDEGRELYHNAFHIEYSYLVKGKKYIHSNTVYNELDYSISDKIEIEYVKTNSLNSRIKGLIDYRGSYFTRHLFRSLILAFFGMNGLIIIFFIFIYFMDFAIRVKNYFRYGLWDNF